MDSLVAHEFAPASDPPLFTFETGDRDPQVVYPLRSAGNESSHGAGIFDARSDLLAKRAFDAVGAALLLLFTAPLLLVTAILVAAHFRAWPIFRQQRTGRGGRTFLIWKFRSLYAVEDGAAVRAVCDGDSRLSPFGAFLRRYSIDELPQLWNVLKGDMSLVGPRPHAVFHDSYYGERLSDYPRRFRVRPGMTGLAQINGSRGEIRALGDMQRRVEFDNLYIDNWSLWSDVEILLRTATLFEETPAPRPAALLSNCEAAQR